MFAASGTTAAIKFIIKRMLKKQMTAAHSATVMMTLSSTMLEPSAIRELVVSIYSNLWKLFAKIWNKFKCSFTWKQSVIGNITFFKELLNNS